MVNAGGFRSKINLLFIDPFLEVFSGAFQDYFSHYLCNSRKHANTHSIFALNMGILFQNVDNHPLFPCTRKHLGLPGFANIYFKCRKDPFWGLSIPPALLRLSVLIVEMILFLFGVVHVRIL